MIFCFKGRKLMIFNFFRDSWTWLARLWLTWSKAKLQRKSGKPLTSKMTSLLQKRNKSERKTNGAKKSKRNRASTNYKYLVRYSTSFLKLNKVYPWIWNHSCPIYWLKMLQISFPCSSGNLRSAAQKTYESEKSLNHNLGLGPHFILHVVLRWLVE